MNVAFCCCCYAGETPISWQGCRPNGRSDGFDEGTLKFASTQFFTFNNSFYTIYNELFSYYWSTTWKSFLSSVWLCLNFVCMLLLLWYGDFLKINFQSVVLCSLGVHYFEFYNLHCCWLLMQNMYEDGDEEMKKTIAKAWTDARSGKAEMGASPADF